MRNRLIICATLLMGLVACKKDRDCTCTVTSTTVATFNISGTNYNVNEVATETQKFTVKKTTKGSALSNDCASSTWSGPISLSSTQTNTAGSTTNAYTGTLTKNSDCSLD